MNWIARHWQDAEIYSLVLLQNDSKPNDVTLVKVSRREPVQPSK